MIRASGRANAQRGITMVETLVALLVLSIGMLGIAGLYVETMRSNRTAMIRSLAVSLVQDMSDRIRANARAQGAYDMAAYGGNPAVQGCAGGAANCTDTALAEDDLARWRQQVLAQLPGAATNVTYVAAAGANVPDRYSIQVTWAEAGSDRANPGAAEQYSYQTNLELLPVVP